MAVPARRRLLHVVVTGAITAGGMVVFHGLGSSAATPVAVGTPVPISIQTGSGDPLPGDSGTPAIADGGEVVVFVTDDGSGPGIAVRELATSSTELLGPGIAPGISGDGCTIGFWQPTPAVVGPPGDHVLVVGERCDGDGRPIPVDIEVVDPDVVMDPAGSPALSSDGAVIVVSRGDEIVRYERSGGAYVAADRFDTALGGTAAGRTGERVDVSDDGRSVVYTAGRGGVPFAPDPSDVYRWSVDGGPGAGARIDLLSRSASGARVGRSTEPSMSGNGRLVAFASTSPELAPSDTRPPDAPFVVLADGDRAVRVVVEDGDRPTLSNDGHHIVYVEGADVRAQRWGSGDPFVDVVDELVVADVGDAVTPYSPRAAPAVSRHGRWVTVESANGAALSSDIRFHGAPHVWVVERGGPGPPAAVDLGSALPGGELRTTLAVVNDGSFGIPVAIVTATSPFRTTRTDCVGVLHPATSCTVDVAVTISGPGSVTGDVTLTGSGWSPATIVVPVGATGQVPPTTVPPTTVPPTTQPPSTRPPVIVPPTRPRPTLPRPTRPPTVPSRPGGGLPSSGSTPSPQPADTVRFEPAGLTFGPTVIGAGRATSTIVLLDPDGATGVVVDVRIESGGTDFTVAENPCTGSVVPAGGCPIEVLFAPVATGSITATLVAEFADGTIVRAQLTGTASPPPTLSVSPSVADPGQVVALSGAGFPVGRSVQVGWLDGRMRRSINVDADGSFREPLVVLPSSRSGPTEVTVLGQPDLFDDVTATLLVGRVQRSIAPSDVRRAVVGY